MRRREVLLGRNRMGTPFTALLPLASTTAASMTPQTWLFYGFGCCYILTSALLASQVHKKGNNGRFCRKGKKKTIRRIKGQNAPTKEARQIIYKSQGLQCYGCNIIQGQRYVDVGCSNPEIITCSHAHKGFKHRFCIKTESTALGILLTSGCATARHCHQKELPGVRIHCCDTDLCNGAPGWRAASWHYICTLASLLLLWWRE